MAVRIVSLLLAATVGPLAQTAADGDLPGLTSVEERAGLVATHATGAAGRYLIWESVGPGVAIFDYDGDGRADVYLPQGAPPDGPGDPNPVFRNLGGRFESPLDRPAYAARPDRVAGDRGYGMGAVAGDYDRDGHPDLYVTNHGANVLFRNNGDGTFEEVASRVGVDDRRWSTAALWADVDDDGDPDLLVVNYLAADHTNHRSCRYGDAAVLSYCGPSLFDGVADEIYRNEGDGTFLAVGAEAGVAKSSDGKGMAAAAIDHDDDGDIDLYVANDTRPNFLYVNRGGSFGDEAMLQGAALSGDGRPQAGMGIVWDDLDGDLDPDLVVTNFQDDHNTFYRREGEFYVDVSAIAGMRASSLAWVAFGLVAFDPDLDGDLDLYVANGHIYHAREFYDPRQAFAQPNQLYLNDGAGRFSERSDEAGPGLEPIEVSRGAASGDLDDDGDPDLVVANNGGPLRLLAVGDWASPDIAPYRDPRSVRVRLVGRTGSRDGHGARVICATPSRTQVFRVQSGGSFMSQSDGRVLCGIANASGASLEVVWPNGGRDRVDHVPGGSDLVVTEGRGITARRGERP